MKKLICEKCGNDTSGQFSSECKCNSEQEWAARKECGEIPFEKWNEDFDKKFPWQYHGCSQKCFEDIKDFIANLLREERARFFEAVKKGRICLNCGKEKDTQTSDWCADCLENK